MNTRDNSIHIIGISSIASNDESGFEKIGSLWHSFLNKPFKEKLVNMVSSNIFAVYSDYENGHKGKYKLTLGYAVDDIIDIPDELSAVTIPAGNYKVYKANSPAPEDIFATWQTIWSTEPNLLPRNYVADFEEYAENTVTINIGCD